MQIVALVDCRSFFVSCERVFNPSLSDKPVVVLSNNDGCIISRSDEAKKLGLHMDPYFKVKKFCKKNNVSVFSANFALYGDMSSRVMSILDEFSPDVEIYSIDEAFISLDHISPEQVQSYAEKIKETIMKYTGIPVCIGVSTTKSLAKLAQSVSKKTKTGVYTMLDLERQEKILQATKPSDIWGIGANLARTLGYMGIDNALEFRDMNSSIVRKHLKLSGQKLQYELKGIPCYGIEQIHEDKKNIASTRSFSKALTKLEELEFAISEYTARASEKMRAQNSVCSSIYVYIRTNMFNYTKKYAMSAVEPLQEATYDTSLLIKTAKKALRRIYKKGYEYKKAGIILMNLTKADQKQLSFERDLMNDNSDVMPMIDEINSKMGKKTLFMLAQGIDKSWQARRELVSNQYTTKWEEIITVN